MRRAVMLFVAVGATVRPDVTHDRSCDTCTAEALADSNDPAPLLVVLHGNNETGRERSERWREAIERRGWRLLALDCPREHGCDDQGRWYMWNGNPRWIADQVRELGTRVRIDTSRIYLAGWSGGATYIGKRMPAWTSMFAGVVIHGGGVPPRDDECPDRPLPAYFLVGDENPAHGGSQRLRDYFEGCNQDVKWDLLPGANHSSEDAALSPEKADEILQWLSSRRSDILS